MEGLGQVMHDALVKARNEYCDRAKALCMRGDSFEENRELLENDLELKYLQGKMDALESAMDAVNNELRGLSNAVAHLINGFRSYIDEH